MGTLLRVDVGNGCDLFGHLIFRHIGDLRDLDAVLVEQRDVEEKLQVVVLIVSDIRRRSPGIDDAIALLPNPDGVGLYSREFFQILYGIDCQRINSFKSIE